MTPHAVAAQARRPLLVLALLAVMLVGFAAQPAAAHERREVGPRSRNPPRFTRACGPVR